MLFLCTSVPINRLCKPKVQSGIHLRLTYLACLLIMVQFMLLKVNTFERIEWCSGKGSYCLDLNLPERHIYMNNTVLVFSSRNSVLFFYCAVSGYPCCELSIFSGLLCSFSSRFQECAVHRLFVILWIHCYNCRVKSNDLYEAPMHHFGWCFIHVTS
jgi:hypothetical protein